MIKKFFNHKYKSINYTYLLGFLISAILAIGISYKVTPLDGALAYNDYAYFFNHSTNYNDIGSTFSPNYLGQYQISTVFLYLPKLILISLLSFVGLGNAMISYIIFTGVFIFCSYVYFIIVYRLSNNIYYSILSQIIIVINNLSLEHIRFGGVFYYYLGLTAFGIILYNIHRVLLQNKIEIKNLLYIILGSILLVHPFYFVIFAIIWVIFTLYWIIIKKNISELFKIIATGVGALLINLYWLLPFIINLFLSSPSEVYAGGAKGVMDGFKKVASYLNITNGYQYFDFFAKNFHGNDWNYIFYPLIIFIIFISYIYFNKKVNRSFLNLGIILFFIFLHLSLGPNSRILGSTWSWMWENVSAFQFFRSFSRFQIVLLPIIIFIFTDFEKVWKYKYRNFIYLAVISLILVLNIKMFTGNFDGNIVAIKVPKEYDKINEILQKDTKASNILSLPNIAYESYTWSINDNTKIATQDYLLKDYLFIKPIIYNRASLNLQDKKNIFGNVFQNNDFSELNKLNVGYILVQKDMVDIINDSAPILWEDIKKTLDKDKNNFEKLIENEYYIFYKYLPYSTPVISNSNSKFTQINPWHYEVNIKEEDLNENLELILLKNYNAKWKVYLENKAHQYNCNEKQENIYLKDGYIWAQQCEEKNKSNRLVSFIKEITLLFNTKTFNPDKYENYANKWSVSKQSFDNYKDGADLTIIIYYKPQIYLYLGVIVTIITMLSISAYLLLIIYNKKMRNNIKVL